LFETLNLFKNKIPFAHCSSHRVSSTSGISIAKRICQPHAGDFRKIQILGM
jgi:hypothetical protein